MWGYSKEVWVNETTAMMLGGFVLCVWPLLFAVGGYMIGKYGMPFSFRWRGFHDEEEDI